MLVFMISMNLQRIVAGEGSPFGKDGKLADAGLVVGILVVEEALRDPVANSKPIWS